jgi:hypothetical protein
MRHLDQLKDTSKDYAHALFFGFIFSIKCVDTTPPLKMRPVRSSLLVEG